MLLLSLLFSVVTHAETLAGVESQNLTGLSGLSSSEHDKVLSDAKVFSQWRKAPAATASQKVVQTCAIQPDSNSLCPLFSGAAESTVPPVSTPRPLRQQFVATLASLDDPETRRQNCALAEPTLRSLKDDPLAKNLRSRTLYWLWVCAVAQNHAADASQWQDELWIKFPMSYHTLLALADDPRLQQASDEDRELSVSFRSLLHPELNPLIAGLEALHEMGDDDAAADVTQRLCAKLNTRDPQLAVEPEVRLYVVSLINRIAHGIPSVLPVTRLLVPLLIDRPDYRTPRTLRYLMPLDYKMSNGDMLFDLIQDQKQDLDGLLVLALVHHESALNPRARSALGAVGLTQLLLVSANEQYRAAMGDTKAKVSQAMLFDPVLSLRLGVMDFKKRLKRFRGNLQLTLAAYNAGEEGVEHWLKESSGIHDTQLQMDLLFMNRENEYHVSQYVSAILAKYEWYKKLYKPAADN